MSVMRTHLRRVHGKIRDGNTGWLIYMVSGRYISCALNQNMGACRFFQVSIMLAYAAQQGTLIVPKQRSLFPFPLFPLFPLLPSTNRNSQS